MLKTSESGNEREQTFCPDCGSPLYSATVGDGPKHYGIRLGTVNERHLLSPTQQIWFDSAQRWTQSLDALFTAEKQS